jgi:hypothetical protein
MFRAKLTINKITREKRPALWPGVLFAVYLIASSAPRTKSPGVTAMLFCRSWLVGSPHRSEGAVTCNIGIA